MKVRPGLPHVEIDSTMKEKIKAAMIKRFNVNLKALDLSRFHTDPGKRMLIVYTELIHIIHAVIYLRKISMQSFVHFL